MEFVRGAAQAVRRRAWAWLAAGTVAGLVAAACGGGPPATPTPLPQPTATQAAPTAVPTPTATPAPTAEQPQRGGILKSSTAFELTPSRYDVPTTISSVGTYVFSATLNALIQFDPYRLDKIAADLATDWTVSGDGKQVTFNLRRDVSWQDGVKFTSADAAWSLDRVLNPAAGAPVSDLKDGLAAIDKIETPDEFTLKLALKNISASLIPSLANVRMLVYPKHLGIDGFVKSPTGTGPFKFSKAEPNVSIQIVRSEGYFKAGLPYLDGVTYFSIPDETAALAAFRAGRVDFLDRSNNQLTGHVKDILGTLPEIQIDRHIAGLRMLYLNSKFKPFADIRVRKAINLAIDRQQVVDVIEGGDGVALAGPNIPASLGGIFDLPGDELAKMPGYRKDKGQDIVEAKRLLQEAGVEPGTLKPVYITEPRNINWVTLAAEQLKAIGIEAQIKQEERSIQLKDMVSGNFDLGHIGALPLLDDPSQSIATFWLAGGVRNYGKFSNPEIDDLYQRQDQTLDPAARKQLVDRLQRVILDSATVPLLDWGTRPVGIHPWVKNMPHMALFWSNGYRMEQVWLSKR